MKRPDLKSPRQFHRKQQPPVSVAALMTCFNRRAKTLACLDSLATQTANAQVQLSIFLVDDASTDGTGDAVRQAHPDAHVIGGNGQLFWAGGMRKAYRAAMEAGVFDHILWLNDDTNLQNGALDLLLNTSTLLETQLGRPAIIVGATRDPETHRISYGGYIAGGDEHPLELAPIEPAGHPVACTTFNGNCVLIPWQIAQTLGNLDERYSHAIGDLDYGFRAHASGIPIHVAPGFVGTCTRNALPRWQDPDVSIGQRLKYLHSPKGLPPAEWAFFLRRVAPGHVCAGVLKLYLRALFPRLWTLRQR